MKKIRVSIGGNGRVTIKLKKESPAGYTTLDFAAPGGAFLLSSSLINQMEIRVESIFRPGQPDVETVYALSGSNANFPDMLHKFSSNEVVMHSEQNRITTATEKMADHILKERAGLPKIIIIVHTHPDNVSELSGQDKSSMVHIARRLEELIPGAKVIFAVHAVSREMSGTRTQTMKTGGNRIKWSSITRIHEIAFFNKNSEPIEMTI